MLTLACAGPPAAPGEAPITSPGRFLARRVREYVQRQLGITLRVSLVDAVAKLA